MLIVYLIKRMKGRSFLSNELLNFKKMMARFKIVLFFLIVGNAYSNNERLVKALTYNVVKNNIVIGTIEINQYSSGDSIIYKVESNIKAKYVVSFNISGSEKSIYKDDVLVYSSVYRTLNNKVKVNHKISYTQGRYILDSFDKESFLSLKAIEENLIRLYFKEPKDIDTIYSDNLNQMVKIKSLGSGKYRVDFEKGKYNIFYYQNGTCVKIEAYSSLYNVTLIPS